MGDVIQLVKRTPTPSNPDLPPCGNAWGPNDCPEGGPHLCWTWQGWPHICRCMRCHFRAADR